MAAPRSGSPTPTSPQDQSSSLNPAEKMAEISRISVRLGEVDRPQSEADCDTSASIEALLNEMKLEALKTQPAFLRRSLTDPAMASFRTMEIEASPSALSPLVSPAQEASSPDKLDSDADESDRYFAEFAATADAHAAEAETKAEAEAEAAATPAEFSYSRMFKTFDVQRRQSEPHLQVSIEAPSSFKNTRKRPSPMSAPLFRSGEKTPPNTPAVPEIAVALVSSRSGVNLAAHAVAADSESHSPRSPRFGSSSD